MWFIPGFRLLVAVVVVIGVKRSCLRAVLLAVLLPALREWYQLHHAITVKSVASRVAGTLPRDANSNTLVTSPVVAPFML